MRPYQKVKTTAERQGECRTLEYAVMSANRGARRCLFPTLLDNDFAIYNTLRNGPDSPYRARGTACYFYQHTLHRVRLLLYRSVYWSNTLYSRHVLSDNLLHYSNPHNRNSNQLVVWIGIPVDPKLQNTLLNWIGFVP